MKITKEVVKKHKDDTKKRIEQFEWYEQGAEFTYTLLFPVKDFDITSINFPSAVDCKGDELNVSHDKNKQLDLDIKLLASVTGHPEEFYKNMSSPDFLNCAKIVAGYVTFFE